MAVSCSRCQKARRPGEAGRREVRVAAQGSGNWGFGSVVEGQFGHERAGFRLQASGFSALLRNMRFNTQAFSAKLRRQSTMEKLMAFSPHHLAYAFEAQGELGFTF